MAACQEHEEVAAGSFVIEALDAATGDIVWSGITRVERVEPGVVDEVRLRRAVSAVPESFPRR
jgi:hypothetical protein